MIAGVCRRQVWPTRRARGKPLNKLTRSHEGKNIDADPYSIVYVSIHGSLEEVLSDFDAEGTVSKTAGQAGRATGRRRA